ncbi:DNA mismatch repair protein MutL [Hesseltinella vesiculosa]|uniref:DNA mismatch repair protein PMS1 n=1 Tax=Hesseltinella vesiculosa TaxID=101127 RepID=A0A1X2G7U6_9FUNG|nr:DNA mismatch repair protein MutL [Hesseltinella vesiculosa]
MASIIKPIDKFSIHRICSGQVISDLASSLKELIENSVDANATSIDVTFKDNGLEGIEVTDNGSGIDPSNYESLALKHHTSKIADFSDLEHIVTFGFRGEALSSLCAIARVIVTTATKDQAPKGVQLEYDREGQLVSQTPIARSVGTTVSVTNLFHTLPVRLHEFKRNIKRDYSKALALVQSYCVISTGIRVVAFNDPSKGPRTRLMGTSGNADLRDNLTNVFGAKLVSQLQPFEIDLTPNIQGCITGYISKPQFGLGRKSGDRQYFFINGRPCTLSKIAKTFNEIYQSFIANHYPFVIANLKIPTDSYDVNVTPDKRTIYLHQEHALVENIIEKLGSQFEPSRSTYDPNPMVAQSAPASSASPTPIDSPLTDDSPATPPTRRTASLASSVPRSLQQLGALANPSGNAYRPLSSRLTDASSSSNKRASTNTLNSYIKRSKPDPPSSSSSSPSIRDLSSFLAGTSRTPVLEEVADLSSTALPTDDNNTIPTAEDPADVAGATTDTPAKDTRDAKEQDEDGDAAFDSKDMDLDDEPKSEKTTGGRLWRCLNRTSVCQISYSALQLTWQAPTEAEGLAQDDPVVATFTKSLKQADLNVDDNDKATRALNLVISKQDFAGMKILGQFNLGFIIVLLHRDLFIIDQHAADEKFNFETLQLTTVINGQKLIKPQHIDLTPSEELIVMDNTDIFHANGFDIQVDPEQEPTHRIKIVSQPFSRNTMLDKKDISELVHLIDENPGKMVRCSRIRSMFASRACRKSVMIGDSLNSSQMDKIIRHMGEINQPWNCPHGRPTMRHLITLPSPSHSQQRRRIHSSRHILTHRGSLLAS